MILDAGVLVPGGHAGGKSRARGSSVITSLDYEFRVERKEDDEEMIINLEQT